MEIEDKHETFAETLSRRVTEKVTVILGDLCDGVIDGRVATYAVQALHEVVLAGVNYDTKRFLADVEDELTRDLKHKDALKERDTRLARAADTSFGDF